MPSDFSCDQCPHLAGLSAVSAASYYIGTLYALTETSLGLVNSVESQTAPTEVTELTAELADLTSNPDTHMGLLSFTVSSSRA